jgi:hypothetical protein
MNLEHVSRVNAAKSRGTNRDIAEYAASALVAGVIVDLHWAHPLAEAIDKTIAHNAQSSKLSNGGEKMSEQKTVSALVMDRAEPLGNSIDQTGRRALHTVVQGGVLNIQGVSIQGRIQQLSLVTTAWTAAPLVPLANRNSLIVQNTSVRTILWNYTNNPAVTVGFQIPANGIREIMITDDVIVYLRAVSAAATVIVEELA